MHPLTAREAIESEPVLRFIIRKTKKVHRHIELTAVLTEMSEQRKRKYYNFRDYKKLVNFVSTQSCIYTTTIYDEEFDPGSG